MIYLLHLIGICIHHHTVISLIVLNIEVTVIHLTFVIERIIPPWKKEHPRSALSARKGIPLRIIQ